MKKSNKIIISVFAIAALILLALAVFFSVSHFGQGAFAHDDHSIEDDHDDHSAESEEEHEGHDEHEGESEDVHELLFSEEELLELGIELDKARMGQLSHSISLNGEIALNEDNVVKVAPRISGSVSSIYAMLGQKVGRSTLLAELESRELAEARADYIASFAKAELAISKFNREKSLFDKKLIAEQDFLDIQQEKVESEIERDRYKQQLFALGLRADEIKGEYSQTSDFNTYRLRAPFAGTIIEKNAVRGQTVAEGESIFTLADLSTVWCDLVLYPEELGKVKIGLPVTVLVNNHPAAIGVIGYIRPILGRSTRSSIARITLDNRSGKFIPGMYVGALVETGHSGEILVVKKSAVMEFEGRSVVFVYHDGEVRSVDVETALSDSEYIEITSGLKAGERYLSENGFVIKAELQKESFGGHVH